ncbi:MAG: hypothetical protein IK088_04690 [Lachnospiraceae bacterium]|nr:hypothetical protein [Lachnospiraceae bacterium]
MKKKRLNPLRMNSKKALFKSGSTILAVAIMFSFLTSPIQAAPTSYNINVPIVQQAYDKWCWAACGASVVNYYGGNITQYNFSYTVQHSYNNVGKSFNDVANGLAQYGINSSLTTGPVDYSTVQYNSYNLSRPLLIGICSLTNSSYGHMVLISGYTMTASDDRLILMNPEMSSYWTPPYANIVSAYPYYWAETMENIY